jgi:predicted nuclease of predicted toxin-antitoxin system
VDENTAKSLAFALRGAGYVAEHVCEVGLQGRPDTEVFAFAQAHQQTIITADLDFAHILNVRRHTMASWFCAFLRRYRRVR